MIVDDDVVTVDGLATAEGHLIVVGLIARKFDLSVRGRTGIVL